MTTTSGTPVNLLAAVCAARGEEFIAIANMDEWNQFWADNTTDGSDSSELEALGGHDACLALARKCELAIGGGAAGRFRIGFVEEAPAFADIWEARSFAMEFGYARNTSWDFEWAARNLVDGIAAFGPASGVDDQPARLFLAACNRTGSVTAAQAELAGHFTRNGRDVYDREWVDTLVPLNEAARVELEVECALRRAVA